MVVNLLESVSDIIMKRNACWIVVMFDAETRSGIFKTLTQATDFLVFLLPLIWQPT